MNIKRLCPAHPGNPRGPRASRLRKERDIRPSLNPGQRGLEARRKQPINTDPPRGKPLFVQIAA
jgi:hypothetical protein